MESVQLWDTGDSHHGYSFKGNLLRVVTRGPAFWPKKKKTTWVGQPNIECCGGLVSGRSLTGITVSSHMVSTDWSIEVAKSPLIWDMSNTRDVSSFDFPLPCEISRGHPNADAWASTAFDYGYCRHHPSLNIRYNTPEGYQSKPTKYVCKILFTVYSAWAHWNSQKVQCILPFSPPNQKARQSHYHPKSSMIARQFAFIATVHYRSEMIIPIAYC